MTREELIEQLRKRALTFGSNGPAYAPGSKLVTTRDLLLAAADLIEQDGKRC